MSHMACTALLWHGVHDREVFFHNYVNLDFDLISSLTLFSLPLIIAM